jgi:type VI secretion system secreted protein Hcp
MSAFLKMTGLDGEATDQNHKAWILIESLSTGIHRSIPEGAKDQQRSRGQTTAGDIVVVRQMDATSVKLQEAVATGKLYKDVEVHLCNQVEGKQEPYLKYKLENVIVSSYSFHGSATGSPLPSEEITMNYTKATWTYIKLDPKTGKNQGQVEGAYDPGEHKGS